MPDRRVLGATDEPGASAHPIFWPGSPTPRHHDRRQDAVGAGLGHAGDPPAHGLAFDQGVAVIVAVHISDRSRRAFEKVGYRLVNYGRPQPAKARQTNDLVLGRRE